MDDHLLICVNIDSHVQINETTTSLMPNQFCTDKHLITLLETQRLNSAKVDFNLTIKYFVCTISETKYLKAFKRGSGLNM